MNEPQPPPPLSVSLASRLSFMMFLQYAIWGAWLPLMYQFLSRHRRFEPDEIGYLFMIGGVGAIVAPFIAGQVADRHFNTEKYLGLSHIIGGVLVWQLSWITDYWGFFAFSLLYSLIYSPTLALTNSLSFHHLPDRDRDFGKIRLWGTIGWIAVGIGIGQFLLQSWTPDASRPTSAATTEQILREPAQYIPIAIADNRRQLDGVLDDHLVTRAKHEAVKEALKNAGQPIPVMTDSTGVPVFDYAAGVTALALPQDELIGIQVKQLGRLIVTGSQAKGISGAFVASAILGIAMGLYCFTLPRTPPSRGRQSYAVGEASTEIKRNPLLTLFLIAVPISCIHQFYFVHTSAFLNTYQAKVDQVADAINKVFGVGGGGLMTIGQMSEIVVLALIPFFAKKASRKTLLLIGIAAYALRMFLFAHVDWLAANVGLEPMATLIAGVALHGLCFGLFVFVAFMVVDEETTPDVRASAQSLFGLVIFGIGIVVGSIIAGYVGDWASRSGTMDYRKLFDVPMWGAIACFMLMLAFYPRRGRRTLEIAHEPR